MRIALVTTAYNEADCIESFINEAHSNLSSLLSSTDSISSFEICIANNCSKDNTLELLLQKKSEFSQLRVIDNSINYGYDVSILNCLKHANADVYLVMCSDFEDPFSAAFEMLKKFIHGIDDTKSSILGVKSLKLPIFFRLNRYIYYLISGFGSRTSTLPGFHGFGVYSSESINRALDYALKVSPNARKALLWGSPYFESFSYLKSTRRGGKSSYTIFSYYKEALDQIFELPSLSSRLAIRFSLIFILMSTIAAFFFVLNWFGKFMIFPNGTTTIIMLIMLSSCFNLFVSSLLARQLENLVMPNSLNVLASREL